MDLLFFIFRYWMAQAAKGPQDDWSLGENEQCRHIINIIFTDLRNSIRLRDVNELILKLTSNNLLDNEKFKYKNEKTRGIKFQGLICADENGINQDSWKTRDTLMFWIKDIQRSKLHTHPFTYATHPHIFYGLQLRDNNAIHSLPLPKSG